MYKDHSVVVVKPLTEVATNLNLLDILVKVKDEGRHPVLEHAGSMLKLGISGAEYEETERKLREGLEKLQKNEPQGISNLRCTIVTCIRDLGVDTSSINMSMRASYLRSMYILETNNTLTCRAQIPTCSVGQEGLRMFARHSLPRLA